MGECRDCVRDRAKSKTREPSLSIFTLYFFFSFLFRSNFIVRASLVPEPLSIMKAYSLVCSIRGLVFTLCFFCRLITRYLYNVGTLSPSLRYRNSLRHIVKCHTCVRFASQMHCARLARACVCIRGHKCVYIRMRN